LSHTRQHRRGDRRIQRWDWVFRIHWVYWHLLCLWRRLLLRS